MRKLLLHKDEIIKLSHAISAGGYTLIPLKLYFSDGRAKVEIAVAKGKREFEKRQTIREREDKREAERAMRSTATAWATDRREGRVAGGSQAIRTSAIAGRGSTRHERGRGGSGLGG